MKKDELKDHYKKLYAKHGISPLSLQWQSKKAQDERYKILTSMIEHKVSSVVDVGCGFGDLYVYMRKEGYFGSYIGVDFVSEFIEYAQKHRTYPVVDFIELDFTKQDIPQADYIFSSGVFNNKMADNRKFMLRTIKKMFAACHKGIAFNSLSKYVRDKYDYLYYSNPLEIFEFCQRNLTEKVTLKHDYYFTKLNGTGEEETVLEDYTMFLYK